MFAQKKYETKYVQETTRKTLADRNHRDSIRSTFSVNVTKIQNIDEDSSS